MGEAEVGERIGGYELEARLGGGSTSQVFRARATDGGPPVAVKVSTLSVLDRPEAAARMMQEAQAAARLSHPHVARVLDVFSSTRPPRIALVLELLEGPSMRALRGAPLPPAQARVAALQLVAAVAAMHRAGVIHRDLKPDNILFRRDPREEAPDLVVVDFGLAKPVRGGGLVQTAAGVVLGTPAYMAPEQIVGRASTPATDVYAVAELVFELFSGERAFTDASTDLIFERKLRGEVPPLALSDPAADTLRPLLERALAYEPTRRPGLHELAAALDRLSDDLLDGLSTAPSVAREAPLPTGGWVARRPRPVEAGATTETAETTAVDEPSAVGAAPTQLLPLPPLPLEARAEPGSASTPAVPSSEVPQSSLLRALALVIAAVAIVALAGLFFL